MSPKGGIAAFEALSPRTSVIWGKTGGSALRSALYDPYFFTT